MNDDGDVVGFDANNTSYSFFFKFKTKIKGQTCENSAKDVETAVPLKLILPYLVLRQFKQQNLQ